MKYSECGQEKGPAVDRRAFSTTLMPSYSLNNLILLIFQKNFFSIVIN